MSTPATLILSKSSADIKSQNETAAGTTAVTTSNLLTESEKTQLRILSESMQSTDKEIENLREQMKNLQKLLAVCETQKNNAKAKYDSICYTEDTELYKLISSNIFPGNFYPRCIHDKLNNTITLGFISMAEIKKGFKEKGMKLSDFFSNTLGSEFRPMIDEDQIPKSGGNYIKLTFSASKRNTVFQKFSEQVLAYGHAVSSKTAANK